MCPESRPFGAAPVRAGVEMPAPFPISFRSPDSFPTPSPTSIRRALAAFLRDRQADRFANHSRTARVVAFLELCVDNHAHRNLGVDERARYEAEYARGRLFGDLFPPRRLLDELDFFVRRFLKEDVVTSEAIESLAGDVVAELKRFLVERRHVTRGDLERADEAARRRVTLRQRARRAARLLAAEAARVEAPVSERLPCDDHLILRVESNRLHLLAFRDDGSGQRVAVDVGDEASSLLAEGWCLCSALSRGAGRWRLRDVHEVYPRFEPSR